MKDTFASVYLFNYLSNTDALFASAIEDRDYVLFSSEKKKNISGDFRGRPPPTLAVN